MKRPDIDFAKDPLPGQALHDVLDELRAEGDAVPVRWAGQPAWLICGHDALLAAFRDETAFPAGASYEKLIEPIQGRTFESMDGPEHHLYRKLATPAFRSRAVERIADDGLRPLAEEILGALHQERELELVEQFLRRYPFLVISRMLGIPRDAEDDFHRWATGILAFDRRAAAEFTAYLEPLLALRRREPQEDVISGLVHAEHDGVRLSDEEVLSNIRALFSAGAATTHDAIGNLIYALLTQPELWALARDEPARRADLIEEALRWETPVAVLPRLAPRATCFLGVDLPDDATLLFGIAGANRDPAYFRDPHRFDPDRKPTRALTFGLGSHSCPGSHLARREIRIALDTLVDVFPRLRLLDVESARPRGRGVRGPERLHVAVA